MKAQHRISGKELGALAMPGACPRCFWIRRRVGRNLPFQVFPGIFSSIDAYTKRMVHGWFDVHGCAPPWLSELGKLSGYIEPPSSSKFRLLDPETNIILTGIADGILVRPDGSHLIVDYKTARHTPNQDALFPVYEIQLNCYAMIAESIGLTPVTELALIYAEPVTDIGPSDCSAVQCDAGFDLSFAAMIAPVRLDLSTIPPLLRRVRAIIDLDSPPPGGPGCDDCSKLDELLSLLRSP